MIVRLASSYDDQAAQEMYYKFTVEGYCPFGAEGCVMGFVKDAKKDMEGYLLIIEVIDPAAFDYMKELEMMREK